MPGTAVRSQLEAVAEELLRPYIERLRRSASIPEARIVNDPIWGSIRLEPWEVALIDSPLMQRLRGLRQLGVVHWVYPSAVHTRFEHSIGVMHCASEILSSLERSSGLAGAPVVGDETHKLVRVAALLHDSGHTILSHVGEHVADHLPGMPEYRSSLTTELRPRKTPSASEAIAVGFVRSPAFRDLLGAPQVGADFVRDPAVACEQIARLIVGAPAIDGRAFLSLVISGAFDADKLDYMVRDCFMAGVPCAVDVSRAIGKLHCVEVQAGEKIDLLQDYRKWAGVDAGSPVRVLALPRSATTVLNELAVTRGTLYEKIYFHPKVRALEAVARRVLGTLGIGSIAEWIRLADEVVLREATFRRLRERDLPKRAFEISRPTTDEQTAKSWRRLTRKFDGGDFEGAVAQATREACEHLAIPADAVEVYADRPRVQKLELDAYAFIGDSSLDLDLAAAGAAGQRAEAGKFLSRERVYVFAASEVMIPACLASRKVVGALDLDTSGHTTIPLKIEPTELLRASEKLEEAGYFGTGAGPLAPDVADKMPSRRKRHLEDFLRTAIVRIQVLAGTLGRYQAADGRRVDVAEIAAFLRQFQTRERARAALRMLEAIDFVDRQALSAALHQTIRAVREQGHLLCVSPLGGLADSSSHLAYLMLDLPASERADVISLPEALARRKRGANGRIVLWDDFCSAGGHARTVLAQWLGLEDANALDERHVDPLEDPNVLREHAGDLVLGFARAREAGLANLREAINAFGLAAATIPPMVGPRLVADAGDLFTTDSPALPDAAERDDLAEFLRDRARAIFEERDWDAAKRESRLLGYGNTGLLVAFPYNVPTVTVTPLWAEREGVWRALLPRRAKPPTSASPVGASRPETK